MHKAVLTVIGVAVAAGVAAAATFAWDVTGPSSSQSPYLVRSQAGVITKSILTVGDAVGGYRLAGLPDGLGAFDNGDGTFTVLANHEIRTGRGAVRAHGASGSFVSRWTIRKGSLAIVSGGDLIQQIATWNTAAGSFNPPTSGVGLNRLCSADLPPVSALFDAASGLGYAGRLFMDGEEGGAEGRAFAHALDGTSYELASLGKFAWENSVARPVAGPTTVVVGTDDGGGGQVYVYAGQKRSAGNPAEKAGLTGGSLYGIKVAGFVIENVASGIPSGTRFTGAPLGDVSATTGAQLETASDAAGVTEFLRPEDAAWDPSNPNDLYFVTTAGFTGRSRLWRLRFDDPADPAAGGTIDQLLEGTEDGGTGERLHMLDNLTVDDRGNVMLQEDPGKQPYLARIWQYDIESDSLTEVAAHDPERFAVGAPQLLTNDEESSGIIDVSSILGEGWYLLDVQAHYTHPDPALVEGGQLLAMHVPPGKFPKQGNGR